MEAGLARVAGRTPASRSAAGRPSPGWSSAGGRGRGAARRRFVTATARSSGPIWWVDAGGRRSSFPARLADAGVRRSRRSGPTLASSTTAGTSAPATGASRRRSGRRCRPTTRSRSWRSPPIADLEVGVISSGRDAAMWAARTRRSGTGVVRSYPLIAPWLEGEPITGVDVIGGIPDIRRCLLARRGPTDDRRGGSGRCVGGHQPVPRPGGSIGLRHAVALRHVLRCVPAADPSDLARCWMEVTEGTSVLGGGDPTFDRHRIAEMTPSSRVGATRPTTELNLGQSLRAAPGEIRTCCGRRRPSAASWREASTSWPTPRCGPRPRRSRPTPPRSPAPHGRSLLDLLAPAAVAPRTELPERTQTTRPSSIRNPLRAGLRRAGADRPGGRSRPAPDGPPPVLRCLEESGRSWGFGRGGRPARQRGEPPGHRLELRDAADRSRRTYPPTRRVPATAITRGSMATASATRSSASGATPGSRVDARRADAATWHSLRCSRAAAVGERIHAVGALNAPEVRSATDAGAGVAPPRGEDADDPHDRTGDQQPFQHRVHDQTLLLFVSKRCGVAGGLTQRSCRLLRELAIRASPRSTTSATRAEAACTSGSSRWDGSMRAGFSAQPLAQDAMSGSAPKRRVARVPRTCIYAQSAGRWGGCWADTTGSAPGRRRGSPPRTRRAPR